MPRDYGRRAQRHRLAILVGDRIRLARTTAEMQRTEVAYRCGISESCLAMIELGYRVPSLQTAIALCHEIGMPLTDMITVDDL